jgi:uncharacterized protein (DUF1330 family)
MNRSITIALAMLTSAGLGAAVIQGLHAQTTPPAFHVAEITVTNEEGYTKEYVPPVVKSIKDGGGKFVVRGGKTVSIAGSPAAPRVVIIQFDSLDKAQAWVNSPAFKAAQAIGEKHATFRLYQVEGVAP